MSRIHATLAPLRPPSDPRLVLPDEAERDAEANAAAEAELGARLDRAGARRVDSDEAEEVRARPRAAAVVPLRHTAADVRLPRILVVRIERELAVEVAAAA